MNRIEWKKTLEKASEDLYKTLNTIGPSETLKLLLEFSKDDLVVQELLATYPSIVSIGDFLFGRPILQLDRETFRTLFDANPEILIKKEKDSAEKERNVCKRSPQKPGKPRSRKKHLTSD